MPASVPPGTAPTGPPPTPAAAAVTTGSVPVPRRSRARRARESAYGMLLLARLVLLWLLVAALLVAGVRTTWDSAQHILGDGRERGTLTLVECVKARCVGTFEPADDGGTPRDEVVLRESLGRDPGDQLAVALRPGTNEALRTGLGGLLDAALPLTGALLLAAVVVGGGLRMYRTGWATAAVGLAALTVTFALW